jgi:hypothetical protein
MPLKRDMRIKLQNLPKKSKKIAPQEIRQPNFDLIQIKIARRNTPAPSATANLPQKKYMSVK